MFFEIRESVIKTEHIRQSREGSVGCVRLRQVYRIVMFAFHMLRQERGAPARFASDQLYAAFGVLPIPDHDEFELIVQKFFGGFFVLRIDFSFSYSVFIDPRAMRVACHSVPVLPPPAVMRPTIVSPSMRPLNSSRELTPPDSRVSAKLMALP